jgi:hypothetical protein
MVERMQQPADPHELITRLVDHVFALPDRSLDAGWRGSRSARACCAWSAAGTSPGSTEPINGPS